MANLDPAGTVRPSRAAGTGSTDRSGPPMVMPNFVIFGAPKAGTTALYQYLRQHPEIFMSPVKEPGFFDYETARHRFCGPGDQELYRTTVGDLDAYRALFRGVKRERAIGEASVYYLYSPVAAERMHALIPHVRLVAVLRNPVERAYSAFLHNLSDGREPLTDFAQALREEEARLGRGFSPFWYYRRGGFYHRYLTPFFARFDRSQIRVYLHEDFEANPIGVLQDIFRFLEVDDRFVPDVSVRHNVSGVPRSKRLQAVVNRPSLLRSLLKACLPAEVRYRIRTRLRSRTLVKPDQPAEVRAQLAAEYRADVLELQDLLGRDLSAWLR